MLLRNESGGDDTAGMGHKGITANDTVAGVDAVTAVVDAEPAIQATRASVTKGPVNPRLLHLSRY